MLQVEADELIKEVENSIAEFKRQNQDYDEDRIKDQVLVLCNTLLFRISFLLRTSFLYFVNKNQ